ncbi:MAG: DUF4251 domain-containing protein [Prevotellaceae bacterium]|jgi:hypothetical protein|nr:DUF4251 domain-containing protein [Prevotellaceae bacterium]
MKKIYLSFVAFFLLNCGNIFAQSTTTSDYQNRVSEILTAKDYRIDILNLYRENSSLLELFSTHFLKIKNDKIEVDFPYFIRNDNYETAAQSNVKLNAPIVKYNAKEKKKQGLWKIKIAVQTEQASKYDIVLNVYYDGYCTILVNSPQKKGVMYDGRIKVRN